MATIKPFPALRPRPELADQIAELPYDVMSSDEARQMADGNPLSFLHVSKPEIDLPRDTNPYSADVYGKGGENMRSLIDRGALVQQDQPCFYLYRQVMGKHSQLGLVAVASCQEYLDGIIRRHEFTRPDKEDDRVRHMEALNAQTGPVFLTYPAQPTLDHLIQSHLEMKPDVDFTATDGVRHTAWTIREEASIRRIEAGFAGIPALYIADGHHRSAAAARVFQTRNGAGHSGHFLTVIFPHDQMQILPYNRVIKDLHGLTAQELLAKLKTVFMDTSQKSAVPTSKHEVSFFIEGQWRLLRFRPELTSSCDPFESLDVTLLQKHVLSPLFAIHDPRTSKRINFVGGIRGTAELEKLVNSREYACAFSMFPTSIEDLMSIADAGGVMPPKSTWFEPKLRDGLFSHVL